MASSPTGKVAPATGARRGRGRPQLRSDEETRALIFAAARHDFAGSGFAGSNMESVARGAGISTKTLYRLIPNKAALFEAMITDRLDDFAQTLNLHACESGDIAIALREALLVCAGLVLNPDVLALQRMVLAESDKFPELAQTFYTKAMRRTVGALATWLRVEKEQGRIAIEDPEDVAGILLGMMAFEPQRAMVFGKKPPPTQEDLEQRAYTCVRLFLNGARASSTRRHVPEARNGT